jgi:hypothetical protein
MRRYVEFLFVLLSRNYNMRTTNPNPNPNYWLGIDLEWYSTDTNIQTCIYIYGLLKEYFLLNLTPLYILLVVYRSQEDGIKKVYIYPI